jgi:heme-degrading monooxygenase HmoA
VIHIVWEFQVKPKKTAEFERHYSGSGTWAAFFKQGEGYHGTVLVRDTEKPGRYLTFDLWDNVAAFHEFKAQSSEEYFRIDRQCEALTEKETCLGIFEVV